MAKIVGDAPRSPFTGFPGWDSIGEQLALIGLAATSRKDAIIVEIGSEYGQSLSLFAIGNPTAKIFSIDINPDLPAVENIRQSPIPHHKINFITADGGTYKWYGGDIDLLFIDGDHTYEAALADLVNWTRHVRVGGMVAIHDCACSTNKQPHESHYAVLSAVQHWKANAPEKWQLMTTIDSMMIYRKRGDE